MPEEITPKIVRMHDMPQFDDAGRVTTHTIVQFMLGRHGPFQATFDHKPQRFEIQAAFDERRAALEGFV